MNRERVSKSNVGPFLLSIDGDGGVWLRHPQSHIIARDLGDLVVRQGR